MTTSFDADKESLIRQLLDLPIEEFAARLRQTAEFRRQVEYATRHPEEVAVVLTRLTLEVELLKAEQVRAAASATVLPFPRKPTLDVVV